MAAWHRTRRQPQRWHVPALNSNPSLTPMARACLDTPPPSACVGALSCPDVRTLPRWRSRVSLTGLTLTPTLLPRWQSRMRPPLRYTPYRCSPN